MPKILFICKKRHTNYGISYGLLNSCLFVSNALNKLGIKSKAISVVDNNCIDREVSHYRPTHVFIEALWVVPEKFKVLIPLHPTVKWYVRLHSKTPFLANEGIAMEWLMGYEEIRKEYGNLMISPNSKELCHDLNISCHIPTAYTPNVYFPPDLPSISTEVLEQHPPILNVGCFGAIRPFKNQLVQAIAAIAFAEKIHKTLHFHINATRLEQHGEQTYRNIKHLFKGSKHESVEHPWCDHAAFILLVKKMDIGLQVSFSETFNIVAADFVSVNIPLVGSSEIQWLSCGYKANPTNTDDIIFRMGFAYYGKKIGLQIFNKIGLYFHNSKAMSAWMELLQVGNS
jgi:hypothetical protein